MLLTSLCQPLKPVAGTTLRVVLVCRTPTPGPDFWSRACQGLSLHLWLIDRFVGPIEEQIVAGNSAGRADVGPILKLVHGGNVDLVLAEDLSHITRRRQQIIPFLEVCQLHHTRVIAIESRFDSAQDALIECRASLGT